MRRLWLNRTDDYVAQAQSIANDAARDMARMSEEEQLYAALMLDRALCEADPYYFITTYVKTMDDSDGSIDSLLLGAEEDGQRRSIIRDFPDEPFVQVTVRIQQTYRERWWEKSRQNLFSLENCAMDLWDANFHAGRTILLHCDSEPKAGFGGSDTDEPQTACLLGRILFMWNLLPAHIQTPTVSRMKSPAQLTFRHYDRTKGIGIPSVIIALSDNPESARQYTCDRAHNDEVSFQRDARRWYAAWRPSQRRSATSNSDHIFTPNGREYGYQQVECVTDGKTLEEVKEAEFEELLRLEDLYEGQVLADALAAKNDVPRGPRYLVRETSSGKLTAKVYWRADRTKTMKFERAMRAALDDWQWRQEFELDNDAKPDQHPRWRISDSNITEHIAPDPKLPIIRVWDFGIHAGILYCQIAKFLLPYAWLQLRVLAENDFPDSDTTTQSLAVIDFSKRTFGTEFRYVDVSDVAGRQRTHIDSEKIQDVQVVRKLTGIPVIYSRQVMRHEAMSTVDNLIRQRVGVDGHSHPGFLIARDLAPVLTRAMQGAIEVNPRDGGLLKSDANDWWNHLADDLRYVTAHFIRITDVRYGQQNLPGSAAGVVGDDGMTPMQRFYKKQHKEQDEAMYAQFRQKQHGTVGVLRDRLITGWS